MREFSERRSGNPQNSLSGKWECHPTKITNALFHDFGIARRCLVSINVGLIASGDYESSVKQVVFAREWHAVKWLFLVELRVERDKNIDIL